MIALCLIIAYVFLIVGPGWVSGVFAFMGLCLYALKYSDKPGAGGSAPDNDNNRKG